MALSPLSVGSVNRVSTPIGTLTAGSKFEAPEYENYLGNHVEKSNTSLEKNVDLGSAKSRQSLSPFKGLSPRKTSRSHNKRFSIFDEQATDEKNKVSSDCVKSLSESSQTLQSLSRTSVLPTQNSSSRSSEQQDQPNNSREKNIAAQEVTNLHIEESLSACSTVSDGTCFSNFSAIPNTDMTVFASLKRSPTRTAEVYETPRGTLFTTPSTSKKPGDDSVSEPSSPTPQRNTSVSGNGDTTNLLLDFTQQFESYGTAHVGGKQNFKSPSKFTTEPNLLSYVNQKRTPSPTKMTSGRNTGRKSLLNLLDFDLPPQPTPRSIPSITVRELESLKSKYLSEISHLRACLSGREAEVDSLKKAVGDAERRVGEAQENLRDEKNARHHAESEKSEWEKKGEEVETLLKSVKEEFLREEKENEELLQKLEENIRLREDTEIRLTEMTTKAAIHRDKLFEENQSTEAERLMSDTIAQRVAKELDEKMENLAHELHAVYKKKHESKVAILKKAYEMKAEKKRQEMQKSIDDLLKKNEELQAKKDSAWSEASRNEFSDERAAQAQRLDAQNAELLSQNAVIDGLKEEVKATKEAQAQLIGDLEMERLEKGELVAAVDEMLALQSEIGTSVMIEDLKKNVTRPSGLRGPGFSDSRIAKANSSGIGKGIVPAKSRMMSNIERMGRVPERDG